MANNGVKIYQDLMEYNTATGRPTGNIKPNDPSDPDYVAPIEDPTSCPLSSTSLALNLSDNPITDNSASVYDVNKTKSNLFLVIPALESGEVITIYFTVTLELYRSVTANFTDTTTSATITFMSNGVSVSPSITFGSSLTFNQNDMTGTSESRTIQAYITLSSTDNLSVSLNCASKVLNTASADSASSEAFIVFNHATVDSDEIVSILPEPRSLAVSASGDTV